VRAIGHPIQENGVTVKLRGVFQNIHHIKTAQLQLEQSLELLKVKNKKLDNFAHIISHNLKGYATNLNLIIELFDTINSTETYPLLIEKLRETSNNLNETLTDVSSIIKNTDEEQIINQNVSFEAKLNGVLNQLDEAIKGNNITIKTDFKIQQIQYNPAYLESIFYNLLSNSIKYKKPNEPCLIEVATFSKNGTTHLSVTDNGIGIDTKRFGDSLFKMYKVIQPRNDSKGLGLYITKTQIEIMGGTIRIESTPNVGTTFVIDFNR
jgi:signal transduction histidine kinase